MDKRRERVKEKRGEERGEASVPAGNSVENDGGNAREMPIGKAQIGKQIKRRTVRLEKSKHREKLRTTKAVGKGVGKEDEGRDEMRTGTGTVSHTDAKKDATLLTAASKHYCGPHLRLKCS